LTMIAAEIVDNINHPRRLGGKSRKVSEAIEWYFTRSEDQESLEDLRQSRKWWMDRYDELKNAKSEPSPPTWRGRILAILGISR